MGLDGWISGWVSFRVKGEDLGIICQIRDEANEMGKFKIPIIGEAGEGRRGAASNRISAAQPLQSLASTPQVPSAIYMQQSVLQCIYNIYMCILICIYNDMQPSHCNLSPAHPRSPLQCSKVYHNANTTHPRSQSSAIYICSKL